MNITISVHSLTSKFKAPNTIVTTTVHPKLAYCHSLYYIILYYKYILQVFNKYNIHSISLALLSILPDFHITLCSQIYVLTKTTCAEYKLLSVIYEVLTTSNFPTFITLVVLFSTATNTFAKSATD